MDISEYISGPDFCRICGVTGAAAEKWRRTGVGPKPIKIAARYLYLESETLIFAAERFRRKVRERLSRGIVKAMTNGKVTMHDAKSLAHQLGYESLSALDIAGVESLIRELDALAAKRPRPPEDTAKKRKQRVDANKGSAAKHPRPAFDAPWKHPKPKKRKARADAKTAGVR